MIDFKNEYSREDFLSFLDSLTPNFEKSVEEINIDRKFKFVKSLTKIGQDKDLSLKVFEINHESENDPRVSLSKETFISLRELSVAKALIVFRNEKSKNYRLSLITFETKWDGGTKIKTEFSNPRRYSFFLGPNSKTKTPNQFLTKNIPVKDSEDLKGRFSIEVVNKEFYKEISHSFTKLVGGMLKLPDQVDKNQASLEFAVRLIGRIIFCWFLKEKKSPNGIPLIPKELLSRVAIDRNEDYYHKILEPIFFEILNRPIKDRIEEFRSDPYSTIPYLNGGLFSDQKEDYYKRGIYQSDFYNSLVVPDEWLKSFFEILETYNFTIDENTSYDEELSIDPEMLGRIFENLLAEINPETGESARKSTGSYYTPRIIVDYMVDESLLLYLKQNTEIEENKLKAVISYELLDDADNPLTDDEKEKIVNSLEKVKILDPACGSGAFPIGALQKIVFILQQVDPDGESWFKKQLAKASPEFRRDIEKKFTNKEYDFLRKLGVIRECIYGVDIQPIATEISRLRCFLTLIVDEHVDDNDENRGIKPLPNLDFKFVTANSLIGLPKIDNSQPTMFDDYQKIDELKEIRNNYFGADLIEREQLKTRFSDKKLEIFKSLEKEHGWAGLEKAELTRKLTDWEPFTHKKTDWFDPEWMFGIKDGFDIVIANPPYDVYQGGKKDEINLIKKLDIYKVSKGGKLNAYKLFLARSSQLQKDKSVLCEIFQNSFLGDNSAKLLREYFLDNQKIIQIDSFPERDDVKKRVFEGVKMSVCILISIKQCFDDYGFKLNVWNSRYMANGFTTNYYKNEIKKIDPISLQIPLLDEAEKKLFSKVYSFPHAPIKCIEGELNMTFHKKYFNKNKDNPKIIKGAAVQRYQITDNLSQGEVEYLDENQYLKDFASSEKSKHHNFPRLAMQGITGVDDKRRIIMAYITAGLYCANSCNYVISKTKDFSLKYLLGLYNSAMINWIFKKTSTNSNVNCYEIENLPIPTIVKTNNHLVLQIDKLVDDIITKKYDGQENTFEYEKQIDRLVYMLYELDEIEIDLIEKSVL